MLNQCRHFVKYLGIHNHINSNKAVSYYKNFNKTIFPYYTPKLSINKTYKLFSTSKKIDMNSLRSQMAQKYK
jgi:hypothetical protein